MSAFGGFGGFGSGSSNNQNPSTGFGGFGSSNNNNNSGTTGFGSSNSPGFGSANNTTSSGLFGGAGGGSTTGGGFGSGGFGNNNNQSSSPFGSSKPAFGSTNTSSGGGLFGGTSTSSAFGGFGSNANNTNQSSGFGSSPGSSSLFGQNKPAFGSATGNTSSAFGGSSSAFGANNNNNNNSPGSSGAFGAPASSAFGGNNQNQTQGTGGTPFSAYSEKDGPSGSNCYFQSISFMQPYQNSSPEELRLADYAQGRKTGTTNGQGGAFGQTSGFGGFGNSTGSAFGGNQAPSGSGVFGTQNTTSSPFGSNNQTSNTGFGTTASTGLFGQQQNKPAGGGLFGSTSSSSQPSGGLFGTSGNTGSGFGGSGFGSNTGTSGGLFGNQNQNQNQNQNKPFGGFGSTGTGFGSGSGGFGSTNTSTTGGGPFANNNANNPSPFGSTQNQNSTNTSSPFGGFGANQNQNQNQSSGGSGLFGAFGGASNQNDQNKSSSLFANANPPPASGLFANQNNQNQQPGGLFANQNNQQSSGSVFGGSKPASSGTGLFGSLNSNNTNTSTGGGVFGSLGNNQNQQNQSSSLFGNNQQQQQQQPKPLFGSTNTNSNTTTGSGLFGSLGQSNTNNTASGFGGSPFGANQQNQQQQPQQGGSLFGASQSNFSQQPQQQQPTALIASLNANPYGNDQLFAGLGTPQQSVGPLATPLSSAQKQRKSAVLPQYKINPAATSRLLTPQKRTPMYGFSYSTYGTPGSAVSNVGSPAGLTNGLLGSGSLGRSVSKSFSTSNLRYSFNASDSILAPGAFSGNGTRSYASSGSMKRLNINRNLRTDFFNGSQSDSTPKKTVSFNSSTTNGETHPNGKHSATGGESSSSLVRVEENDSPTPSAEELGMLRTSRSSTATPRANGTSSAPGMEQVRGNELAVVPEDASPQASSKASSGLAVPRDRSDKKPAEYWSNPTLDELKGYSQEQLKRVAPFTVGRHGCGKVEFSAVDLSKIPLDNIINKIVVFGVRSLTVYPETITKPPQGVGLNVHSTITLENSWPRARAGRLPVHEDKGARFDKHLDRLRRVENTKFVGYNTRTGEWTFTVDHYTTYGLDYDEDEDEDTMMSGALPVAPDSPTPSAHIPAPFTGETPQSQPGSSVFSTENSSPDDTFDFKKGKKKIVPGGFEDEFLYEDDELANNQPNDMTNENSFLGERSTVSSAFDVMSEDHDDFDHTEDQQMAGSFPVRGPTVERPLKASTELLAMSHLKPKSILKASQMRTGAFDSPPRSRVEIGADWTEQLHRTVSPKKPNREALRETQGAVLRDMEEQDRKTAPKTSFVDRAFRNSIDVMNSLFGQDKTKLAGKGAKLSAVAKGFEWPYAKRTKLDDDFERLSDNDKAYYRSFTPSWSTNDTFSYPVAGNTPRLNDGVLAETIKPLACEGRDVRFATILTPPDVVSGTFDEQKRFTRLSLKGGIPFAETMSGLTFNLLAGALSREVASDMKPERQKHEQHVWDLASILFDDILDMIPGHPSKEQLEAIEPEARKDKLQSFWEKLVQQDTLTQVNKVKNSTWANEEKAFLHLSAHNLVDACEQLVRGNDFRLATMVSLAGSGDEVARSEMATQIKHWRDHNVLSEIPESIRALYELLAGNTSQCEGKARGAAEDRASTFRQSVRFKLDWRRSFGLRLWYGIFSDEPLEAAVSQYAADRASGKEEVRPVPWFVEQEPDARWPHYNNDNREDVLWGLLKLYASKKLDSNSSLPSATLESILAPDNLSPNPLHARLAFQLACLFRARNIASFNEPTTFDKITLAYANQLSSSSHWIPAIFVLLHLSSGPARESTIRAVLTRHAADLEPTVTTPGAGGVNGTSSLTYLVDTLHVPPGWIHAARATYARAVLRDPGLEIAALVKAGNVDEAHAVLCRTVAPRAVIANDLDGLRESLGEFERVQQGWGSQGGGGGNGDGDGNERVRVKGWENGGGVYFDFVLAMDLATSELPRVVPERRDVLRRLVERLPGLIGASRGRKTELEERVAVLEMGRWVTEAVRKEDERMSGLEARNTMKLPLTEDAKLKQTMELSVDYYRALIAAGR